MKKIISSILILFLFHSHAQSNEQLLDNALKAYNNGNFNQSIENYLTLVQSGFESSELYYNLANAYYKTGTVGLSIYYYEKALQLNPNDEDILNNLQFAKFLRIDQIEVLPSSFIEICLDTLNIFSELYWSYLSIVGSILMTLCFVLFLFANNHKVKRLSLNFSILSFIIMLYCFGFAYYSHQLNKNIKGIIVEKECTVHEEPNLKNNIIFTLHEGTKVEILDSLNSWRRIKIINGKTGWLSNEDIKTF